MNKIDKIRLDKLTKLAEIKKQADQKISDTLEEERKRCIELIKAFAKRAKDVYALAHAYNLVVTDESKKAYNLKVITSKCQYHDNKVGWYGAWASRGEYRHLWGLSYITEDTSTYFWTIAEDGTFWYQTSYGYSGQESFDDLNHIMAVELADGLIKWEDMLHQMIDTL